MTRRRFKWRKRIFLNFAFLADFTPFLAHTKKTSFERQIASKFCHEMAACAKALFLRNFCSANNWQNSHDFATI